LILIWTSISTKSVIIGLNRIQYQLVALKMWIIWIWVFQITTILSIMSMFEGNSKKYKTVIVLSVFHKIMITMNRVAVCSTCLTIWTKIKRTKTSIVLRTWSTTKVWSIDRTKTTNHWLLLKAIRVWTIARKMVQI